MSKFFTSPDLNGLPITNPQLYDSDSINSLFSDVTQETLEKYQGLIVDSIVSSYFVYSSSKTKEEIDKAKSECSDFASDLFANVSTMSIKYVTSLPTEGNSSIIYVLEKTLDDSSVVHLINLWNSETSSYVETGSLESALNDVVTNEALSKKLNDYALKTEALTTDSMSTTIDETATNATVPTTLAVKNAIDNATVKVSTEADNAIETKDDGLYVKEIVIDDTVSDTSTNAIQNSAIKTYVDNKQVTKTWAEYQALSEEEKNNGTAYYIPDLPTTATTEVLGEVEYGSFFGNDISGDLLSVDSIVDFSNKTRGNLTYDNGVKLTKGKLYLINCNVACVSATDSTNAHIKFDIRINGNQIYVTNGISIPIDSSSKWSGTELVTHYECKNDGEVLTVNITSVQNINTILGGISHLIVTEIPSIQACIDIANDHIKEVSNEWNLFKTVTGNTEIDISSLLDKNELLIESISSNSSLPCDFSVIVLPRNLTSQNSIRPLGYYNTSGDYGCCKFLFNTSIAKLHSIAINGTSIISNCTVNLYYR